MKRRGVQGFPLCLVCDHSNGDGGESVENLLEHFEANVQAIQQRHLRVTDRDDDSKEMLKRPSKAKVIDKKALEESNGGRRSSSASSPSAHSTRSSQPRSNENVMNNGQREKMRRKPATSTHDFKSNNQPRITQQKHCVSSSSDDSKSISHPCDSKAVKDDECDVQCKLDLDCDLLRRLRDEESERRRLVVLLQSLVEKNARLSERVTNVVLEARKESRRRDRVEYEREVRHRRTISTLHDHLRRLRSEQREKVINLGSLSNELRDDLNTEDDCHHVESVMDELQRTRGEKEQLEKFLADLRTHYEALFNGSQQQ